MFSHFFIERPIFATVLSIVIVIVGGVALARLPIAQYPEVTPPTVSVTASYPGASAKVVADTVATPIEQEVNGVENMLYMASRCTNDGQMTLDITFEVGTDLNMAQMLVQNRVAIAESKIPEEARRQGVTTRKKSPSILLCVNLISPKGQYDEIFLSNFATLNIKDELARVKGVGDVQFLGARDYSMRIWLDPNKLAARGLQPKDFVNALREQNVQVAAGRIGQPPAPQGLAFQYPLNTLGRLESEEEFAKIIVKRGADGEVLRVGDLVREPQYRIALKDKALKEKQISVSDISEALVKAKYRVVSAEEDRMLAQAPAGLPTSVQAVESVKVGKDAIPFKELTDSIFEDRGVQLGAKNYDVSSYLDGQPSSTMAVFQLPGSNALTTAQDIRKTLKKLEGKFPEGVKAEIVYDTTVFIEESIKSVYHTLIEAFVLVFLVVLLFLQDWRATILPMIEVPVSLVGTFGVMALLGFSLNNLSLFGLVLAIGIVVDDAIVVIENVETWMAKGLNPKEATKKAMVEVTGAVIAIAVVLSAVFIPTAFLAGITGQFYRQFALTIAASTIISAFNALTMTPARCALIMKAHDPKGHSEREALPQWGVAGLLGLLLVWLLAPVVAGVVGVAVPHGHEKPEHNYRLVQLGVCFAGVLIGWYGARFVNRVLAVFFRGFNAAFDTLTRGYGMSVRFVVRGFIIMLIVYCGLIGLTVYGFQIVPTGFIPEQDKGYLVVNAQLPDGASLERTQEVMKVVDEIVRKHPAVAHRINIPGYSAVTSTNLSNVGGMFVILDAFEKRQNNPKLLAAQVEDKLRRDFYEQIRDAQVVAFGAPPVEGLGTTGGFKMQVRDLQGANFTQLEGAVQNVMQQASAQPELVGLFSSFRANQPQLFIDIDRLKAKSMGVSLNDIFDTLQVYLGSAYVNDFTFQNRNWQVNVQADAQFRAHVEDIGRIEVMNNKGEMVPLETLIDVRETSGPAIVNRYNLFPSAEINGSQRPDVSSGQAIALMNKIAKKSLPNTMDFEWTDLTYQQIKAEESAMNKIVFPLAVILVFMTLASQYESWSLPMAVILIVPMCLLAAIAGVYITGSDNNIFTQIGLVVLIGLAAKNAILIVEFAKQREAGGQKAFDAVVDASRMRLRPILMTSAAFILGVVPLVLAKGAGAEMRVALGIAVFSGMLGVTLFGIFFTPVFYYTIRTFTGDGKRTH